VIDLESIDSLSLAISASSSQTSVDWFCESSCFDPDNSTPHTRFSSGGGLHLIQLWMAHTDALCSGVFRAPNGSGLWTKILAEAATSALQPKKASDIVGNKQGTRVCVCVCVCVCVSRGVSVWLYLCACVM
jgi:hypothetical protein